MNKLLRSGLNIGSSVQSLLKSLTVKSSNQIQVKPIPDSIAESKTPIITYPWLLSTSKMRQEEPTFWSTIKQRELLYPEIERVQTHHLKKPTYDFPYYFYDDIKEVIEELFLVDLVSGTSECNTMVKSLNNIFAFEFMELKKNNITLEFDFKTEDNIPEFNTRLVQVLCTYGAYPIPPGYVAQVWPTYTLVVPEEELLFKSYDYQKKLQKIAMDEGVYIKVDTQLTFTNGVEFILRDKNGTVFFRDYRKRIDVQFCTPHFTPWDEIYELDSEGNWQLRFKWRVSDIDYLISGVFLEEYG
ncbi:hypothetical protein HK099_003023, partial [Clydaea vesicula]